ncbi:MAG: DUF2127 domain-containing protein [Candidatus Acidoferrales bacterium]|nr:DUF2127 domain-containing protein [Candidatus Acidoferrales bacterium]
MNSLSFLKASFRTAITVKGIDGLLEAVGGVLLWFVKPESLGGSLQGIFQHELSRDAHDFIAAHLLHASEKFAHSDPLFASIYLLAHGLIKAMLSAFLWMNELWAYPLAIGVFSAFSVYQVYRFTHTHSITLLLLTVFDLLIVYLTWEEYRVEKSRRGAPAKP